MFSFAPLSSVLCMIQKHLNKYRTSTPASQLVDSLLNKYLLPLLEILVPTTAAKDCFEIIVLRLKSKQSIVLLFNFFQYFLFFDILYNFLKICRKIQNYSSKLLNRNHLIKCCNKITKKMKMKILKV